MSLLMGGFGMYAQRSVNRRWLLHVLLLLALWSLQGAAQARAWCPSSGPWQGPMADVWVQASPSAALGAASELMAHLPQRGDHSALPLPSSDDSKDPPGDFPADPAPLAVPVTASKPALAPPGRLVMAELRTLLRPPDA